MARRMIHMPADTDLNHLFDVWSQSERLIAQHGLKDVGWKTVFDNSKHRGGQCRYTQREIGVSAHLFAIWTYEQCIQIVLHEIAHALCPNHGHDKVWKAKAKEIGYDGSRCWGSNGEARFQGRWIGRCPNGHEVHRQRRSKAMNRRHSCAICAGSVFDARYLISWEENK